MTRSWLIFVSVATVLAAVLAGLRGLWSPDGVSIWIAGASLLIAAFTSGFVSTHHFRGWRRKFWLRTDRYNQAVFLVLFVGCTFSFLFLFGESAGVWGTANPDNLGDMPFHLQLIESFARGAHFPPMDPTFAGEALHYPYAMDLWDALWVRLGIPVTSMLIVTGVIATLVTLIALWQAGDLVLVCAFFLSGGLVRGLDWQTGFGPSSPLVWKNLFLAVFLTQRGFLWAVPAGLYVIRKWNQFLNEKDFQLQTSFFWIWAVLPFFHLHTFVLLSFWMGLTILFERRLPWKLIPASALALFFILRSLTFQNVNSSLGWNWGWMFTGPQSVILNLGPWILVPIYVLIKWVREKNIKQIVISLTITFFALNLKLSPWAWDQVKVLLWVYLLWTFWVIQEYNWKGRVAAIFSFFLFWSGALQWLSGWPSMTGRFEIQDATDRASVQKLLMGLSPNDVVAAEVDYRNPLLGSGQSLVLGYPAHAWSHGLAVDSRVAGLKQILAGAPGGEIFAKEVGVQWLVWKDDASLQTSVPLEAWSKWGWTEQKKVGVWHLWKIVESSVR